MKSSEKMQMLMRLDDAECDAYSVYMVLRGEKFRLAKEFGISEKAMDEAGILTTQDYKHDTTPKTEKWGYETEAKDG